MENQQGVFNRKGDIIMAGIWPEANEKEMCKGWKLSPKFLYDVQSYLHCTKNIDVSKKLIEDIIIAASKIEINHYMEI